METSVIKYTLFCKNGYLFRSDTHFLIIGQWVNYCAGYTILEHGIISEMEYKQIMSQSLVNIYQYGQHNRMSIKEEYNTKYLTRKKDRQNLQSFAGCLHRVSELMWEGRLRVK